MDAKKDPAVFVAVDDKKCTACGEEIFRGGLFLPEKPDRLLCMDCADLDELEFLPSGDATLTRRASKHSAVSYVVLRFSRHRKRFERQGTLVQPEAIEQAQTECAADEGARRERQERNRERLARLDEQFVKAFAAAVREQFPAMPRDRERQIAEHACQRSSGRVGRAAAAKEFDPNPVRLAVIAHIRHRETNYDRLLFQSGDRDAARRAVGEKVDRVLDKWRGNLPCP
jgi:hypothetical protein